MIPARQYAHRLNIHPNTVYAWIARGHLPAEKRTSKTGSVRYYVRQDQPPPALEIGRPRSIDRSLSDALIRARIAYLEARTRAINEQAERARRDDDEDSNAVIHVIIDDDVPAD